MYFKLDIFNVKYNYKIKIIYYNEKEDGKEILNLVYRKSIVEFPMVTCHVARYLSPLATADLRGVVPISKDTSARYCAEVM